MSARRRVTLVAIASCVSVVAFGMLAVCSPCSVMARGDRAQVYAHEAGANRVESVGTVVESATEWQFKQLVSQATPIVIESVRGDVLLTGCAGDEVSIRAVARSTREGGAGVADLFSVRNDDGTLYLSVVDDSRGDFDSGIDIVLIVPETCPVTIHSRQGAIALEQLSAGATVTAGVGTIRAKNVHGGLAARTGSGCIYRDACTGHADLETSRGDVRITQDRPFAEHDKLAVKTLDGRVELVAHPDSAFALTVNSVRNRLDCEFPVVMTSGFSEQTLSGHVGEGGGALSVDTLDGPIVIRSQASEL